MIPVIGSLGIAIGYSVVVGWFLKYLFASVTGELMAAGDMNDYFGAVAGDFGSVGWHMLGLAVTFAIMICGISGGIEKMNKVMMPIFFVFFLILLGRVALLPGAMDGYRYLLAPTLYPFISFPWERCYKKTSFAARTEAYMASSSSL